MASDALIVDLLTGKNTLSPDLKNINQLLNQQSKTVSQMNGLFAEIDRVNAKSKSNELGRITKLNKAEDLRYADMLKGGSIISRQTTIMNALRDQGKLSAEGLQTNVAALRAIGIQAGLSNKQMTKFFREGEISANRFDMRMLSILFLGMQMQRTFGGFLRSITNTFLKAGDNTSALSQSTTRLGAAWEFFKFSLFDALNTPFFISIIDGVINLIDWFSQLPVEVKIAIDAILVSLALLGAGATAWVLIRGAGAAIWGAGGFWAVDAAAGLGTSAGEAGTVAASIKNAIPGLNKLLGGLILTIGISNTLEDVLSGEKTTAKDAILDALMVGLGVGIWTMNPIAGILAGATILLTIMISNDLKDENSILKKLGNKFLVTFTPAISKDLKDENSILKKLYGTGIAKYGNKEMNSNYIAEEFSKVKSGVEPLNEAMRNLIVQGFSMDEIYKEFMNNSPLIIEGDKKYRAAVDKTTISYQEQNKELKLNIELKAQASGVDSPFSPKNLASKNLYVTVDSHGVTHAGYRNSSSVLD